MGKTHEALLRAQKEMQETAQKQASEPQTALVPVAPPPIRRKEIQRTASVWFEELRTKLQTRHKHNPIKTVLFTGASSSVGTTTLSAGFASFLVREFKNRVLLIDVNIRKPGLNKFFGIKYSQGLAGIISSDCKLNCESNEEDLFVITSNGAQNGIMRHFESDRFTKFLKSMRRDFDYIILDGPPPTASAESRLIADKVDGVVLIVEAGKTRRQVAVRAKQELENSGANFLGVILNRRKYYIPQWIYRRL